MKVSMEPFKKSGVSREVDTFAEDSKLFRMVEMPLGYEKF